VPLAFFGVLIVSAGAFSQPASEALSYQDPKQPIETRVQDLLDRMTLKEKIGQMNMPCVYVSAMGRTLEEKKASCRSYAEGTLLPNFGPGGGFFTLPNNILLKGPQEQAEFLNELQTIATEKTRLKIPLLQTEEGTHGLMCSGATIFPEGPALGSTWNLDLIGQVYEATAKEARSIGIHQIFTLVIEPIRDPRLGRNEEAYSEDPFLCAAYAKAIVDAVQGDDISAENKAIAGFCHFPGQSEPVGGLERGAMEISERKLREVFLPPWEAGIKKGGALGVMATYPEIDGVPAHASEMLLTHILRDEYGFEGLVLSEGGGIETLVYEGLAPTQKEAGQLAIKAGVDVGISFESGYMADMIQSVEEGSVPMALIDRAVRRILTQKFKLGLFEKPFVNPQKAKETVHLSNHQAIALQAARESIVLLKNENNLLPLDKELNSIAVIGPNADHTRNQLGDYTSKVVLQDITTILEGVKSVVSPQTKVVYEKGCDVIGEAYDQIERATLIAAEADVALVVLGENEWQAQGKKGTNGEGYDVATLELTGLQKQLVKSVYQTGTPTVVVLVNGRSLAIPWIAENVPAVVESWVSGEKGGQAVAEVLFGEYNPSGKLPVTVARHVGQLPVYYNMKKSKRHWLNNGWGRPYADMDPSPLFAFGHGLSYTSFHYSNLKLSTKEMPVDGSVEVAVDIVNTGNGFGEEIVQLYIDDRIATVSTPILQLRGFKKLALQPGERKTCHFTLTSDHLALYNRHLERVVEPGEFEIMIGSASDKIVLKDILTVK
jgi:beta-glucosidase